MRTKGFNAPYKFKDVRQTRFSKHPITQMIAEIDGTTMKRYQNSYELDREARETK